MPNDQAPQLFAAIRGGDRSAVESLLAADPGLAGAAGPGGSSPILWAVYTGHADLVPLLRDRGAKVGIAEAAATGDLAKAREIVAASPAAATEFAADGFFPLGLAAFFGHDDLARWLLDHGADPRQAARNAQKVTALHAATARHNTALIRLLLERGADPNAPQEAGFVPLHEAAAHGNRAIAELLIAHGARVDAGDVNGKTPAQLAAERGHDDFARWLQSARR
jgi:ankyrin repeat protein